MAINKVGGIGPLENKKPMPIFSGLETAQVYGFRQKFPKFMDIAKVFRSVRISPMIQCHVSRKIYVAIVVIVPIAPIP